jgi:hypothetical protein
MRSVAAYRFQGHARLTQAGQAGVAELVAGQLRQAGSFPDAVEDLVQAVGGERPTAGRSAQDDEQLAVVDRWTLTVQVVADRGEELRGNRYQTLVPALALADEDPTLTR